MIKMKQNHCIYEHAHEKKKTYKHTLTLVDAEPRYRMKFMMNYTSTDDETTADINE